MPKLKDNTPENQFQKKFFLLCSTKNHVLGCDCQILVNKIKSPTKFQAVILSLKNGSIIFCSDVLPSKALAQKAMEQPLRELDVISSMRNQNTTRITD